MPWADLGTEGETRLAERAVSVRCLARPDGSLPGAEDEPDLLAYCARAY
jgi:prolyl-tRNA synthetase